MRIRYLDWKQGARRFMDRMKALERLFSFLLVREDGDVGLQIQARFWICSSKRRKTLLPNDSQFLKQILPVKIVWMPPSN